MDIFYNIRREERENVYNMHTWKIYTQMCSQ